MTGKMSMKSAKAAKRRERQPATGSQVGSASKLIDRSIRGAGGLAGRTLQRVREVIKKADPEIVEEWKWMSPVWSHDGLICTGETYKTVKMTFAKGAALEGSCPAVQLQPRGESQACHRHS